MKFSNVIEAVDSAILQWSKSNPTANVERVREEALNSLWKVALENEVFDVGYTVSVAQIKAWRAFQAEHDAPDSYDSFFKINGICRRCWGKGLLDGKLCPLCDGDKLYHRVEN